MGMVRLCLSWTMSSLCIWNISVATSNAEPLDASVLADGPWLPDSVALNRFDADLLRVRSIAVTIRVESALATLRGPAGPLFSRGGTSRRGSRFLPDFQMRVHVSPWNLGNIP